MRSQAHVETIERLSPIEGADRIELAFMRDLGWQVIVRKGEFNVGEPIVYVEIDSILPKDNTAFAFMENRKYRVRTIKLRGTLSQGLILPISVLPKGEYIPGQDVAGILHIEKYDEYNEKEQNISADERNAARLTTYHKKLMNKNTLIALRHEWLRRIIYS